MFVGVNEKPLEQLSWPQLVFRMQDLIASWQMAVDEGGRVLEATKERRAHAVSAAWRAERRLDEIAVEKDELAHAIFAGDADAERRYHALEEEEQEEQHAHKVAAPYKKKGRILWQNL